MLREPPFGFDARQPWQNIVHKVRASALAEQTGRLHADQNAMMTPPAARQKLK